MLKKTMLFILSLMIIFPLSALAGADYSIETYAMYIEILPDGSADVREVLSYDFDGKYNGVMSTFDTDGIEGIDHFKITIDGEEMTQVDQMTYIANTYTLTKTDENLYEVRVYSPGNGDRRTVIYEYTMDGLTRRYSDTGMLHRKLIGSSSDVTLKQAEILIHFPGNADLNEIEAFVHGGMDASHIALNQDYLSFGPENVSPGDAVEIRLLFPDSWLSEAPVINEPMYDLALSEEHKIALEEKKRAARTELAKSIYTAAYLIIFFGAWALMAKKYGLKGRLTDPADPNRALNFPAAFLTAALEEEADTDALTGTLMELVADDSIRMEPEGEGLRFTRLKEDMSGYYPHQKELMDWLFDEREYFLLSDLNAGADYERAQQFETGYNRYTASVSRDLLNAGLRFDHDALRITLNTLIVLLGAMGAGGVLLAGKPNFFLGSLIIAGLFALLALMGRIRRLTASGEQLQRDAQALKDEGIKSDSGLSAHIPYYAALGMTEPLLHAMESCDGSTAINDMPLWMYTGWFYSLHLLHNDLHAAHYHNASVPAPSSSSSPGHSTGNGGGGGHGAW